MDMCEELVEMCDDFKESLSDDYSEFERDDIIEMLDDLYHYLLEEDNYSRSDLLEKRRTIEDVEVYECILKKLLNKHSYMGKACLEFFIPNITPEHFDVLVEGIFRYCMKSDNIFKDFLYFFRRIMSTYDFNKQQVRLFCDIPIYQKRYEKNKQDIKSCLLCFEFGLNVGYLFCIRSFIF